MCLNEMLLRGEASADTKPSDPMGDPKAGLPDIPPDSPLGVMIAHWEDWPSRRGKSREKVVRYCMQVWGGKRIRGDHLILSPKVVQ